MGASEEATATEGPTDLVRPAMVPLAAATVTLSDRRTERRWSVDVAAFELATVPVTRAEYGAVTGERPDAAPGDPHPVVDVSWWDAVRFCNALSGRDGLTPAYHFRDGAEGGGDDDVVERDP